MRWNATNPMFSRWVTRDVDFFGVEIPKGSVLHICLGAADRHPARWERPDEFDATRRPSSRRSDSVAGRTSAWACTWPARR